MKLAVAIRAQLAAWHSDGPPIRLPTDTWEKCARLERQVRRAAERGWRLAQTALQRELRQSMSSVQQDLTSLSQALVLATTGRDLPPAMEIYEDLEALGREFEELDFDLSTGMLSVTTAPIVLEGVYLGPFEIRWRWDSTIGNSDYRVIAKDPHPAQSRENVTHPHILDEVLCEGDGHRAIRQALAQGRLFDFFALVLSILKTYNSESPFVELALWQGVHCSDCGALVDDDDCVACHRCASHLCDECGTMCRGCEDYYCTDCHRSCPACDEPYCSRCLTNCHHCEEPTCANCLNSQQICSRCEPEEDSQVEPAETDRTENQSDCLGQTSVLARCG
jgi:hypothetical protein